MKRPRRQVRTRCGSAVLLDALLVMTFTTDVFAASKGAQERFLAFGDRNLGWVSISLPSKASRRIDVPGYQPEGVSIAPDGLTVVFTAWEAGVDNNALFRWKIDGSEGPPRSIGDTRGFHADPFVTEDGTWVYFAHNKFNRGGPPGNHDNGAWAELYRARLDGSGLEALSGANGCHVQPFADSLDRLFYLHLNCHSGGRIEQLVGPERVETAVLPNPFAAEPALSSDGRQLLVTVKGSSWRDVQRWALGANPELLQTVRIPSYAPHSRPRFGRSADEMLFQNRLGVFSQKDATATQLYRFPGGPS